MKKEFKVNDKTYFVQYPSAKQEKDAMIVYAKALTKAIDERIISRDKLDRYYREQGLWDDERQNKRVDLESFLAEGQQTLEVTKGIKKSEAKKLALEMRHKRYELMSLLMETSQMSRYTAEGLAEQEKFDYLVTICTKDENGLNVFKNLDDYSMRDEDPVKNSATHHFAVMYAGFDEDFENKLPENKFLKEYGFVNDKGNLVNEQGEEVDLEGKLVAVESQVPVEQTQFLDD